MSEGPRLVTEGDAVRVDLAAEAQRMREEAAAERARHRVTAPYLLDRADAARELAEEERVKLGSRPPAGRWKHLDKFDDRLDKAMARLVEAHAALREAEQAVLDAPRADAETLAAWISGGERGSRPDATLPERERERDAHRIVVEARQLEIDKILRERRAHVEKHRPRMLKEARRTVAERRARIVELAAELAAEREELIVARGVVAWAACYPESPSSFGHPVDLALGLRQPVESTLRTTFRIQFADVVAALEADARVLAERYGADVAEALGEGKPPSPERGAMWMDSEEGQAYKRAELEKARQLDDGFHDRGKLAREVLWK